MKAAFAPIRTLTVLLMIILFLTSPTAARQGGGGGIGRGGSSGRAGARGGGSGGTRGSSGHGRGYIPLVVPHRQPQHHVDSSKAYPISYQWSCSSFITCFLIYNVLLKYQ